MSKSSKLFRFILMPLGLLVLFVFSWSTMVSAAPQTVSWSSPFNRSGTSEKSVYGTVGYDSRGYIHIAWLEYGSGESSRFMYTNNVNGSYLPPFEVVRNAGKNVENITAMAVESNRIHLFYTSEGKSMRHTLLSLNEATPSVVSTTTIGSGKGYAPTATVDSQGRVHAAWIDNRSGIYQVYHRIWSNGAWEGATYGVNLNGRGQDSPSITSTSDGRIYVTYTDGSSSLGFSTFDGAWRRGADVGSSGNLSWLTSDGTTVYGVWSTKEHRIRYGEYRNGSWSALQQISEGSIWSDFPTITYSAANNKLYAAWTAEPGTENKIVAREITPGGGLSDVVTIGPQKPSTWPKAAAGPTSVSVVWQDKSPGAEEIRHVVAQTAAATPPTPTTTPTPPPPSGSLELFDPSIVEGQDGALFTNQAQVSAVIRHTGGAQPDQYGLSDGGDPGDPDQAFAGSQQTVQFSLNTGDGSCRAHQVNGRLQSAQWGISQLFGDSIIYDPSVAADVVVRNPNLTSDVSASTSGSTQAQPAAAPRNFGDPRYTNMSLFYLSLRNRTTECSGLRTYSIEYTSGPSRVTLPTPETREVANGGPGAAFLPGTVQGTYRFRVIVGDNAGNTQTYPSSSTYSMTYDNTAPIVTLAEGTAITPTVDAQRDGVVSVDLSSITVTDNLYVTENANREYYGLWIVVKKAGAGAPSDTEWQFRGVPVVGNGETLRWNVAMGLVDPFTPGEYQLYIRFVDGAGNVSEETVTTEPVQIDALEGPRQFLPLVMTP